MPISPWDKAESMLSLSCMP